MTKMQEIIYKLLLDKLEVVFVADGGGDSTAITIKDSTLDCCQNTGDIEAEAEILSHEIVVKLKKEHYQTLP